MVRSRQILDQVFQFLISAHSKTIHGQLLFEKKRIHLNASTQVFFFPSSNSTKPRFTAENSIMASYCHPACANRNRGPFHRYKISYMTKRQYKTYILIAFRNSGQSRVNVSNSPPSPRTLDPYKCFCEEKGHVFYSFRSNQNNS